MSGRKFRPEDLAALVHPFVYGDLADALTFAIGRATGDRLDALMGARMVLARLRSELAPDPDDYLSGCAAWARRRKGGDV